MSHEDDLCEKLHVVICKGQLFGEDSLSPARVGVASVSTSAVALENTVLYFLDKTEFHSLLDKFPEYKGSLEVRVGGGGKWRRGVYPWAQCSLFPGSSPPTPTPTAPLFELAMAERWCACMHAS